MASITISSPAHLRDASVLNSEKLIYRVDPDALYAVFDGHAMLEPEYNYTVNAKRKELTLKFRPAFDIRFLVKA